MLLHFTQLRFWWEWAKCSISSIDLGSTTLAWERGTASIWVASVKLVSCEPKHSFFRKKIQIFSNFFLLENLLLIVIFGTYDRSTHKRGFNCFSVLLQKWSISMPLNTFKNLKICSAGGILCSRKESSTWWEQQSFLTEANVWEKPLLPPKWGSLLVTMALSPTIYKNKWRCHIESGNHFSVSLVFRV